MLMSKRALLKIHISVQLDRLDEEEKGLLGDQFLCRKYILEKDREQRALFAALDDLNGESDILNLPGVVVGNGFSLGAIEIFGHKRLETAAAIRDVEKTIVAKIKLARVKRDILIEEFNKIQCSFEEIEQERENLLSPSDRIFINILSLL